MKIWKGLTGAAALAALACGASAFAADTAQVGATSDNTSFVTPMLFDDTTTAPATAPAAAPASAPSQTTLTPVMYFLDPTSFGQWLEKYKFNVTGFVEGGYFIDTNNPRLGTGPHGDAPTLIAYPGNYSNRMLLDQADITFSKSVDSTKQWDWGFLVEGGYGADDAFIHSHGILDNRAGVIGGGSSSPENQLDLVQANASILVPLGSGLTITGGKFVAFIGQEVVNPTGNAFFTHSYSFQFGDPVTNTGITGSYTFSKLFNGNDWTLDAGITRGANQSTRDNNGAIDFLGQFKGSVTDKLSLVFNLEEGPQLAHDNGDYSTWPELIATYTVSDQLTVVGDFLYYDAPHGSLASPGGSAQWYGACLYAAYKYNPMFTLNLRGEVFEDQGGAAIALAAPVSADYYEATVGLQIHPFPSDNVLQWLQFRPELRGDLSNKRVYNGSHSGGGDYSELTAAVDVIMQF